MSPNRKYIFFIAGLAVLAGAVFVVSRSPKLIEIVNIIPTTIPSPESRDAKLVFVGDIMLSRQVGMRMVKFDDYLFPFRKIADYLTSADITFGNLESPISSRGIKVGSIYSFRADPKVIAGLQFAGFDVLSFANNHIWDYSKEAFLDTLDHLAFANIGVVGAGTNFKKAHSPWVKEIKGVKFAYLAYTDLVSEKLSAGENTPGVSYLNETQMVADIKAAKQINDFVVVSMHEGDEYQTKHNAKQERIYKEAINAGASFVIGHHPHVVQEVEEYNGGWIAYSLGNFVFDQYFSEETMSGLVLEVNIKDGIIVKVRSLKTLISNDFQTSI